MPNSEPNPIRSLIGWSIFVFLVLLLSYISLVVWSAADQTGRASTFMGELQVLAQNAWQFARPLLQLAIVLVIIDWILRRAGIQLAGGVRRFEWNVQAIIAIVVVVAFALAELGSLPSGGLKDIALVVVGFYVGTQRRTLEVDSQTGKIREVEEHDNPVTGVTEPKPASPSPETS
jgi:hypothetical protein